MTVERSGDPGSKRGSVVSVLDIGTSKMCCMIARTKPREAGSELPHRTHDIEVLGVGHQRSAGVKNGAVVDIAAAENTIRRVVSTAEAAAKVTVGSLIVNVSSGALRSRMHSASVSLGGDEVEADDVSRVVRGAVRNTGEPGRVTIHSLPTSYTLDGVEEIGDPRGMVGRKLSVACHVSSAEAGPVQNIERAVNRAHLEVESMVAAPYAAALAAVVEDEAEMGCLAVDMGAGTTSWALMSHGRFICGDALPVGGHHVTTDLARGLSTSIEQAERLKVMDASVAAGPYGDEPVAVRPLANDASAAVATVPRELVGKIVRARLEETLELVRDRIRASGLGRYADRRVVLTGGASQLTGLSDVARRVLAKNVRIGRPVGVRGLAPMQKTPPFSTVVGLMIYPQVAAHEQHGAATGFAFPGSQRFSRIGEWLRGF